MQRSQGTNDDHQKTGRFSYGWAATDSQTIEPGFAALTDSVEPNGHRLGIGATIEDPIGYRL